MKTRGKGWAYFGFYLGIITSVSGNVANVVLHTARVGVPGRVIVGILVPTFALIGVEIFARVDWERTWRHALMRFVGVLPIAILAAWFSWSHLRGYLLATGEPPMVAFYGPLVVDGTMLMAAGVLVLTRGRVAASVATRPGLATRIGQLIDLGQEVRGHVAKLGQPLATPMANSVGTSVANSPLAKPGQDVARLGQASPSVATELANGGHDVGQELANVPVGHDGWPTAAEGWPADPFEQLITQPLPPSNRGKPVPGWREKARELMSGTLMSHEDIRLHLAVSPRSWRRLLDEIKREPLPPPGHEDK